MTCHGAGSARFSVPQPELLCRWPAPRAVAGGRWTSDTDTVSTHSPANPASMVACPLVPGQNVKSGRTGSACSQIRSPPKLCVIQLHPLSPMQANAQLQQLCGITANTRKNATLTFCFAEQHMRAVPDHVHMSGPHDHCLDIGRAEGTYFPPPLWGKSTYHTTGYADGNHAGSGQLARSKSSTSAYRYCCLRHYKGF